MRKILKQIIVAAFCVLSISVAIINVSAATVIISGDYELKVEDDNTTELNGWHSQGFLTVPNAVDSYYISSIADYAFTDNLSLTGIDFGSAYTLKKIGNWAFKGCSNIEGEIVLPARISFLGTAVFQECTSVTKAELYSGGRVIPPQMFYGCSSLSEVTINYGFQSIGKLAFANCASLSKVTISWTVTEIDSTAFYNCPDLTIYCYTDSFAHQYAIKNHIPYALIDASEVTTYVLGDASGDGSVNINDVTTIQRYLAELETLEGIYLHAADANQDGTVDIADATVIQMYLAEYEMEYPIGEVMTQ